MKVVPVVLGFVMTHAVARSHESRQQWDSIRPATIRIVV
jgi:hypothetical protein